LLFSLSLYFLAGKINSHGIYFPLNLFLVIYLPGLKRNSLRINAISTKWEPTKVFLLYFCLVSLICFYPIFFLSFGYSFNMVGIAVGCSTS
jgi:hypothetical protein